MKKDNIKISFNLSKETLNHLNIIAHQNELTISGLIRLIIKKFLNNNFLDKGNNDIW